MKKINQKPILTVGTKIKIGERYNTPVYNAFKTGEIITLVEGEFDYYNGLYETVEYAPAIWNEKQKEFYSIFHLFGNDLEGFMDCKVVSTVENNKTINEVNKG